MEEGSLVCQVVSSHGPRCPVRNLHVLHPVRGTHHCHDNHVQSRVLRDLEWGRHPRRIVRKEVSRCGEQTVIVCLFVVLQVTTFQIACLT